MIILNRKTILLCLIVQLAIQDVQLKRRNKSRRNCNLNKWRCNNGQCINADARCDGTVNCSDGSDETSATCHDIECPQYAFQCAYGACIAGNHRCNTRMDCADNSDETKYLCDTNLEFESLQKELKGNCNSTDYMQCNSGECIPMENRCDGTKHCSDGSDETVELCSFLYCPSYAFHCGYGGCISGVARCNGVVDCADGSDENEEMCNEDNEIPYDFTRTTPTTLLRPVQNLQECLLPSELPDVVVENVITQVQIAKGQYVAEGTVLRFTCANSKLELQGSDISVCANGKWSHEMPQCLKCCPHRQIQKGISTMVQCFHNSQSIDCNQVLPPGTTASIACAPGYEAKVYQSNSTMRCTENAEWDKVKIQCFPKCGIRPADSQAKNNEKPWDVSIYRRSYEPIFERICGGVIVSPKIVLTASKCLVDSENIFYNIIEGSYDKSFDQNTLPFNVVRHNVSEIIIPQSQQYIDGIGVLILVNHFNFGSNLVPICVPSVEESNSNLITSLEGVTIPSDRGSAIIKLNTNDQSYTLLGVLAEPYRIGQLKFIDIYSFAKALHVVIDSYKHIL